MANTITQVLSFWRDVEIFNIPSAPTTKDQTDRIKIITLKPGETLPWRRQEYQGNAQFGFVHVVHLGVTDMEALSRLLLRAIHKDKELSERELQRMQGMGWMATFVADENGRPKGKTYLPASFALGADMRRRSLPMDGLSTRLAGAVEEFQQRCHKIEGAEAGIANAQDTEVVFEAFTWSDLDRELGVVRSLLGEEAQGASIDWKVVVKVIKVNRQYLEADTATAIEYLNSFYLEDLDRLVAQSKKNKPFGKALSAYLGLPVPDDQRIDILQRQDAMTALTSVTRLSRARWPASPHHPLVLAQQAVVAQIISEVGQKGGTIGVNGPPGTGKTTLLCDVIAEVVTERALRIANLKRPVDLFEEKRQVGGKNFFPLKASVMGASAIVVTSSNNAAVKNITQELPARKKIAGEYKDAEYFEEVIREIFVSQKVTDDEGTPVDSWGLVAAALGNAGNRRSFAKAFFRDDYVLPEERATADKNGNAESFGSGQTSLLPDDVSSSQSIAPAARRGIAIADAEHVNGDLVPLPPTMKQLLEAATNEFARYQAEWQSAKSKLLEVVNEFDEKRAILAKAEKSALTIDDTRRRLSEHRLAVQAIEDDHARIVLEVNAITETVLDLRRLVDARQSALMQLQAANLPNLWDRLLAMLGIESGRRTNARKLLEEPTRLLSQASEQLAETSRLKKSLEAKASNLQERLRAMELEQHALQKKILKLEKEIKAGFALGARHFGDERFWALPNDVRHRASIAVSPQIDHLRSRIFLQSMELHRLTILANAGKFISNFRLVFGMLTGKGNDSLMPEHRKIVWDAFFFAVPVVSTTLASFDRLFAGMGQDSLGWLLIDEAGQATPQSAAGAIWRSQRVVLIGDPLQIEPVFTVPLDIVENLRELNAAAPTWSPKSESVQTLADRITRFGSWIGGDETDESASRIWTGMPLRTHRRCDDLMFSVSNRIAYSGQMVQGKVNKEGVSVPSNFSSVLGESTWFDVSGEQFQHPVVEDEIDILINHLRQLQQHPAFTVADKPGQTPKIGKIYVISPFRKVIGACSARVRQAGISNVEVGTVHTFQGKEADIVFLVLGTAPGPAGAGARSWAVQTPNLLNVAMTRAKCRLYVIGSASDWSGLSFMSELYRALPKKRVGRSMNSLPIQDSLPL
ncbi:DEAD/DEAH box helicase [Undibacterium sp. TJN25]|uniref:DEAD/DEAH box helicase n=1 Tax=Undibacterium sp. TJN25 TaxID=3413056 RepID=UPI003BF0C97A